ncbi:hypothetical protein Sango_0428700 [Sesamum angolense]|uniref:Replication factor A C-terminal domain-containing protein n=1 Tax=Sesamum angolense TaxID=2727404 RepID=A0AAE1XBH9_9LAMI|nr:hypothetical protein Sango_0428700 [Sesamum angolense]
MSNQPMKFDETMNQQTRKRPLLEIDKPTTMMCTVVAVDHTTLCYRVCALCERTLSENPATACKYCNFTNSFNPTASGSKRLFRVLKIGSFIETMQKDKIFVFIHTLKTLLMASCKNVETQAARVLFGCSADEFFDFAKIHPYAAMAAGRALEGEMLTVTLTRPKNGNAQHLRVASVVPLSSGFQPAIETLRELYREKGAS